MSRNEYDGEEIWEKIYGADDNDDDAHVVDASEAYTNGAYTEDGDQVYCEACGEEMTFDPRNRIWKCKVCFVVKTRPQWFDFIDAHRVPGKKCLSQCMENYPICKNWCTFYKIPDDDPIL